jgi:hypothetical protein
MADGSSNMCMVCSASTGRFYLSTDPGARTCSRNCQQIRAGSYPLLDNPTPAQIEQVVARNRHFRQVFYTCRSEPGAFQLVAMHVPARGAVGWERHPKNSQYFKVQKGGRHGAQFLATPAQPEQPHAAREAADRLPLKTGQVWMVEPGQWHDVEAGSRALQMLSFYTPPHHPDDRIDETREAADAREAAEASADLTPVDMVLLDDILETIAFGIMAATSRDAAIRYSRSWHEGVAHLFNGPVLKPSAVRDLERRIPGLRELHEVPAMVLVRGGHVFGLQGRYVIVSSGEPYVQFVAPVLR